MSRFLFVILLQALHSTRRAGRAGLAARWPLLLAALVLAGCAGLPGPFAPAPLPEQDRGAAPPPRVGAEPEKAALQAILSGAEAVPPNDSRARGRLVAVLDRTTGVLRWKLQVEGLSGSVRRAGFHSPGMSGEVAPQVLSLGTLAQGRTEGRARLTPRQQRDLLLGQWYVNLPTERYPDGELRGQLIEQR